MQPPQISIQDWFDRPRSVPATPRPRTQPVTAEPRTWRQQATGQFPTAIEPPEVSATTAKPLPRTFDFSGRIKKQLHANPEFTVTAEQRTWRPIAPGQHPKPNKTNSVVKHKMRSVVYNHGESVDEDEKNFTMFDVDNTMYDYLTTPNEIFVQEVFHFSLDKGCHRGMSPQDAWRSSVVVDIGSNTGFYGLLALAHGCAVVFVEPQPQCNDLISKSIEASGFDVRKVRRIKHPLGEAGKKLLVRPENHCEGRFPIGNKEKGYRTVVPNTTNSSGVIVAVDYVPVMAALESVGLSENTTLQLVKIDTEGFEPMIVEAFMPGLQKWNVLNLVVEVTPSWWMDNGFSRTAAGVLFEKVALLGYGGSTEHSRNTWDHEDIRIFIEHACCHLLGSIGQEDLWLHKISNPWEGDIDSENS